MTAFREVIFWIAIAFFVVSSAPSVIEENQIGVCSTNVSVNVSRETYHIETDKQSSWASSFYGILIRRIYHTTYEPQWRTILLCCEGYEMKNKTCEPQCSSPCMNGYCAQPNTCTCDPGWGGYLCDKPLYCLIRINPPATKNDHNVGKNSHSKPMLPACNSKCHEKFNSTKFNETLMIAGETRYLIPIDSLCNSISISLTYKEIGDLYFAGVIIGVIIFIVMIICCVVCIVRKKRRARNTIDNKPSDSIYNDVGLSPTPDYDEVNLRRVPDYDEVNVPPDLHYDYAHVPRLPEYTSILPSYEYDDVNRPIVQYDDVNILQNPRYVNVNDNVNRPIREYVNVNVQGPNRLLFRSDQRMAIGRTGH